MIIKEKFPKVSIITPTFNRDKYIDQTIKSILKQDYPNIEYIVLDDGSTDDTAKIINKYKRKIIYKTHKNVGEVATVNKGFSIASGEIVGVVNSDDPLIYGAISEIVRFMKSNPSISVVYPDWIKIDSKGRKLEDIIVPEYSYIDMLRHHNCIPGPGTFFRKSVIKRLKGRDPQFKYVSDYDFWLRAGLEGKFARIPKPLATWRSHMDTATYKNKGLTMAMEHIRVINKLYALPDLPHSVIEVKNEAFDKACEAARICRGKNFFTKILIALLCFYYSPKLYTHLFTNYRINQLKKYFRGVS